MHRDPGGVAPDSNVRRFSADANISLVGEIEARRELAAEGWLTINTNSEKRNYPNVDLLSIRGSETRAIQVKTTNAESGSHKHCLYLGRAEGWLTKEMPFFNAKVGPICANIVVLVHARRERSRFVVLPVSVAESLARSFVKEWYEIKKLDGASRSAGFDARIPFTKLPTNPRPIERSAHETLINYENRWDILDFSVLELQDPTKWNLTDERTQPH